MKTLPLVFLSLFLAAPVFAQFPLVKEESTPVDPAEHIKNKLKHITIPKIAFREATLSEALDFLQKRSVELDTTEPDPNLKGIDIVVDIPTPSAPATTPNADKSILHADDKITLSLTNIPLGVALDYFTKLCNLKCKIEPYAVVIEPLGVDVPTPAAPEDPLGLGPENKAIAEKLNKIIIPRIEFREATVRDAIEFIQKKRTDIDIEEPDAATIAATKSFPLKLDPVVAASDRKITLSLRDVPLSEALRYISLLGGLKVTLDAHGLLIVPAPK